MMRITPVGAAIGGECYLLATEQSTMLLDSGFGFCADTMVQNLRCALSGRPLDCILLTHSHYDHAMGSVAAKTAYPDAVVVCSPYAGRIFGREGALKLMHTLDDIAAQNAGDKRRAAPGGPQVDVLLDDNQELALKDITIRCIATPGHTNCSVSFYFPEEDLLALSETTGVAPEFPHVYAAFIVSYKMAKESFRRCAELNPNRLLVPHSGIFEGPRVAEFFARSLEVADDCAKFILDGYAAGMTPDEIACGYRDAVYPIIHRWQSERAFMENANATVARLLIEEGLVEPPAKK